MNGPNGLQEIKRDRPLGGLAMVGADEPHILPVGFRYNPEKEAIEIGGHSGFAKRKKYRDMLENPNVVDDVASVNPWKGRRI
jgi:pyridoxamine 5'-phosphate oxidase family protein